MPIYKCNECSHEHNQPSKPSECDICTANDFKIIEEKKDLLREVKTLTSSKKKPEKTFKPPTFTKPSSPASKVIRKPESVGRPKAPVSDSRPTLIDSTRGDTTAPPKGNNLWTWIAGLSVVALVALIIGLQPTETVEKTVLDENFTNPSSRWLTTEFAKVKDGGLFQQVSKPNWSEGIGWDINYSRYNNIQKTDYSADVKKVNGPDNRPYGILTRIQENLEDYYFLLIASNGRFTMGKRSRGNRRKYYIKNKKHYSINKGNNTINRLRVVTEGNLITGFINDIKVGSFRDDSYKHGNIGVYSDSDKQGNGVGVYFDNIKVIITVPKD